MEQSYNRFRKELKAEYSDCWDCFGVGTSQNSKTDFFLFVEKNLGEIYLFSKTRNLNIPFDELDSLARFPDGPVDLFPKVRGAALLETLAKGTLCSKIMERRSSSQNLIGEKEVFLNISNMGVVFPDHGSDDEWWFRGQSDRAWGLAPSFYRNFPYGCETVIAAINMNYLESDYASKGLLQKYTEIFGSRKDGEYSFLAFMQHAVSYSPFIDFTKDPRIAVSFALSNTNDFNNYQKKDSALFALYLSAPRTYSEFLKQSFDAGISENANFEEHIIRDVETANRCLRSFKTFVCKKYSIGSPIGGMPINSFAQIVDCLTPKFAFFDIKTNDRMRYQKGGFLLFYGCLIIDGKIFVELTPGLTVQKWIISNSVDKENKNKINNSIRLSKTNSKYSYKHLMNPYDYFNE